MNKKKIVVGSLLLISFFVVLVLIFMPIYPGVGPEKVNALVFSDNFFNSLAKGSSNYMDDMRKLATPFKGQNFDVEMKFKDADQAKKVALLYTTAGAQVEEAGAGLRVKGDLGQVMFAAIDDSDAMFHNQGDKLKARYQIDPKAALRSWWVSFKELDHDLTKQKKFKEAKVATEIMKRSIEPGYNFFGISPEPVKNNIGLLTFMLVFYVIYTLWYGYGVFELFEGFGMGAEGGHKEEV